MMDLFVTDMQFFTSQDNKWWTGVVWIIVMFLSAVWTHSDGTHSLQRIHWWASDGMIHLKGELFLMSVNYSFKMVCIAILFF